MPKLSKNKVGIYIVLDEEIEKRLRELIARKYERVEKGLLSYEVQQAIQSWLALHTHAHTREINQKANPPPIVDSIYRRVRRNLAEKYGYSLNETIQAPRIHLVNAIMGVRGVDERTVKKWMNKFTEFKLVKHIAGELYELI